MIKAVLFDMDGVLIDSEALSIKVGIEYFASKGVTVSEEDFAPHLGGGEARFFRGPAAQKGYDIDLSDASTFFRLRYEQLLKITDTKLSGTCLVKKLHDAGIMTAVVSSAPEWKVYANLDATGIKTDDVDLVLSDKAVKRNKPYPDIYLSAAIALGVDPSECLVAEDSEAGIRAGKSAGMTVLSLMTTISASDAASAGADLIWSDLGACPDFRNREEFGRIIEGDMKHSCDGVLYGAHRVKPLTKRLPEAGTERMMVEKAWMAWENAYAPYSHFKVGAAVLSAATGRIYSGCNVENSSYGATICAERNAILSAVAKEGVIGIEKLVVVSDDEPPAPPCAMCLQVLAEFSKSDTQIVLISKKGDRKEYLFSELLPKPFIFPDLRE
ncbi:MAG: cytidine deaminase [Bullifex sp.]